MMRKIVFVPLIAVAALIAACDTPPVASPTAQPTVPATAPVVPPTAEPTPIAGRPSAPQAVTADFREDSPGHVAATSRPQLIMVFSYDCVDCNRIRPVVHQLEADFWTRIDFVYLNQHAQQNREVFNRYGLRGRPVFLLIEPDGTEVTRWFGVRTEQSMRDTLVAYLENGNVGVPFATPGLSTRR